jgi:hypothetical protein
VRVNVAEDDIDVDVVFAALLREVADEDAPRLFALVEEYGDVEVRRVHLVWLT